MREILNGVTRFSDIQHHLGVSAPVLSRRLRALESDGLLERREYTEPGARRRNEYRPTEAGRDLQVVLVALMQWSDRHLPQPAGPAIEIVDRTRNEPVHVALVTDRDEPAVNIRWRPGPGFTSA